MESNLVKIKFFFPKISSKKTTKEKIVKSILKEIKRDKGIGYLGYRTKGYLRNGLIQHIGNGDTKGYKQLSTGQKQNIKKIIITTIKKCNKKLPLPIKNFVFIFPWFPVEKDKFFKGSFGFAVYNCVLHIFLSPQTFTFKSLSNTIAHEINHTISFYYHPDRYGQWPLLDNIINEGLAENFREDVLGGKSAPWATALTKKEAFKILKSIEPFLGSKNSRIHKNIMFGNKKYKRWTGYSIGYWVVKEFRKKHKNFTWEKVMKKSPENILKSVIKII